MESADRIATKITAKLTSAAFLDDSKIKAVGLPAIAGVSLAWRVRVTASSDPLFYAQIFPRNGKYCARLTIYSDYNKYAPNKPARFSSDYGS